MGLPAILFLFALISPRLYKEPKSIEDAIKVFEEEKGKSFEPCIADAVIALKNEIVALDRDFKTYEGAKFDDELSRWKKYYPELENFSLSEGMIKNGKKSKGAKTE